MITEQDRAKAQRCADAVVSIAKIMLETIEQAGNRGIPSGHLYAALMGLMTLEQYQSFVSVMVKSGRVRQSNHVLYSTLAEL